MDSRYYQWRDQTIWHCAVCRQVCRGRDAKPVNDYIHCPKCGSDRLSVPLKPNRIEQVKERKLIESETP